MFQVYGVWFKRGSKKVTIPDSLKGRALKDKSLMRGGGGALAPGVTLVPLPMTSEYVSVVCKVNSYRT